MRTSVTYNKTSLNDRKAFLTRTALDTVASFKLEGIVISIEDAYKMAEEIASKAEKEGRLVLA